MILCLAAKLKYLKHTNSGLPSESFLSFFNSFTLPFYDGSAWIKFVNKAKYENGIVNLLVWFAIDIALPSTTVKQSFTKSFIEEPIFIKETSRIIGYWMCRGVLAIWYWQVVYFCKMLNEIEVRWNRTFLQVYRLWRLRCREIVVFLGKL